jgi:hypothetical protein
MRVMAAFLIFGAFTLIATPAPARSSGPLEFLQKIDRQLCAKFKTQKCKRHANAIRKAKSRNEKPAAVTKPVETQPASQPEAPIIAKVAAVLPRTKPAQVPPPQTQPQPVMVPKAPEKPPIAIAPTKPTESSCLETLKNQGVEMESVAEPTSLAGCSVPQPVQLKSVPMSGVALQLPDHPVLNCEFAKLFVSWLKELGGPAATASEGFAITELYTGPGYQCRGRNGDSSSKISEHGHGNAIDIERIKFSDGQVFHVHDAQDPSAKAYATLKAIRTSACARFSTVLGPGTNPAHSEHFHFDAGIHGKSASYKICE